MVQRASAQHLSPGPSNLWSGEIAIENKEYQSHEDREAQTLVDRIEKKVEASEEIARQAETKRTLDDYGKKVGSSPAFSPRLKSQAKTNVLPSHFPSSTQLI